jgi:prepilin peptidase CpaA
MTSPLLITLSILLVGAAVVDVRFQKIPNWLTFPFMVAALVYYGLTKGPEGLLFSFQGLVLGLAFLIVPWLMGGMGAGDVKLLAAVGAAIGPMRVFVAFLCTAIAGCVYAALVLLTNPRLRKSLTEKLKTFLLTNEVVNVPSETSEPVRKLYYGAVIAIGTLCSLLMELIGHPLLFG